MRCSVVFFKKVDRGVSMFVYSISKKTIVGRMFHDSLSEWQSPVSISQSGYYGIMNNEHIIALEMIDEEQ